MKYIITAQEFKTSAKIIKAIMKETGIRSSEMQATIDLIRNQEWDKVPTEPGVTLVLSEPDDEFGTRDLIEVIVEVSPTRNVEFMETMIPWIERLAPVGIAMWGMLKVFKNVLGTMRDDVHALTKKWNEEDKAAASQSAAE